MPWRYETEIKIISETYSKIDHGSNKNQKCWPTPSMSYHLTYQIQQYVYTIEILRLYQKCTTARQQKIERSKQSAVCNVSPHKLADRDIHNIDFTSKRIPAINVA